MLERVSAFYSGELAEVFSGIRPQGNPAAILIKEVFIIKKVISIIIILMLVLITPLQGISTAEAAIGGVLGSAVGKAVLGTLLISMGYEYFDIKAMLSQSWHIWGSLPATVQQSIESKVQTVEENIENGELPEEQYISLNEQEFSAFRQACLDMDEYLTNNEGEDMDYQESVYYDIFPDDMANLRIDGGAIITGYVNISSSQQLRKLASIRFSTLEDGFNIAHEFNVRANSSVEMEQTSPFYGEWYSDIYISKLAGGYLYPPNFVSFRSDKYYPLGQDMFFSIAADMNTGFIGITLGNETVSYSNAEVDRAKIYNFADGSNAQGLLKNVTISYPRTWNIDSEDYSVATELVGNPAYDLSDLLISISSLLETLENYIGLQASDVVTDIPAPVEEEQPEDVLGWLGLLGGLIGDGTKSISDWLRDIRQGQIESNAVPGEEAVNDSDIDNAVNDYVDKIQVGPLSNSLGRLQNIQTGYGEPPRFTINLNALALSSRYISNLSESKRVFPENEYTLIDFAIFENYEYMGLSLIEMIRALITFGVVYTTILYIWRKVQGGME